MGMDVVNGCVVKFWNVGWMMDRQMGKEGWRNVVKKIID